MADRELTFTTRPCGGDLFIEVDYDVIKARKNKKILFKNQLDKADPADDPVTIEVSFFEAGTGKAQPVEGVCKNVNGSKLVIDEAEFECRLDKGALFSTKALAYTVETPSGSSNPHEKLDPVIIIQPQFSSLFLSLGALFGGIVAAVVGRLLLRAFSKGQQSGSA